ncbi:hypothetical protein P7K49_035402, partial [Saguinus oedipus]
EDSLLDVASLLQASSLLGWQIVLTLEQEGAEFTLRGLPGPQAPLTWTAGPSRIVIAPGSRLKEQPSVSPTQLRAHTDWRENESLQEGQRLLLERAPMSKL